MSYVWEEEYLPQTPTAWGIEWHLKKQIPPPDRERFWKISVAWVRKLDERKYRVVFQTTPAFNNDNKTFRSLKAAKAYALAIITLTN